MKTLKMPQALLLATALLAPPALASSFTQSQAEALASHRRQIVEAARAGELSPASCRYFVKSFAELRQHALAVAASLREDAARIEAIPELNAALCH